MHELSVITPELSDDVFVFAVDAKYLVTVDVVVQDDDVSRHWAGCHILLDELVVRVKDIHAVLAYVCNYEVIAVGDGYAMQLIF